MPSFNEEAFVDPLYDDPNNGCIIKHHKLSNPCDICKTVTDWIVITYNPDYIRKYKAAGQNRTTYNTQFDITHICSKECYEQYKANRALDLAMNFDKEENPFDF